MEMIEGGASSLLSKKITKDETLTLDDIIKAVRSLWGEDPLGKVRAYSFMLFVLLVVPCAVALAALKQEFGWKMVMFETIALLIVPYIASTLFFNIARLFI